MRKAQREWVNKYPSIQVLEKAITGPRRMGSMYTLANYIMGLQHFVANMGFEDPELLLGDIKQGKVDARKAVDKFIDGQLGSYAHGTVRIFCFGIKKWLKLNGVEVNWGEIEFPTATEQRELDDAPSKQQLMTFMTHSPTREKAVIEVLSSSGLRIGTLLTLKVGDVNLDYPDVASITVRRKRGRKFRTGQTAGKARFYMTFITPEAKEILLAYLKERERGGEQLTSESPLITDAYNKGATLNVESYEKVWGRMLRRAGLDKKSVSWFIYHIHTLRKYFRSNCVGVDPSYRERWMGHRGGYLDESYFKVEEEKHLTEYRKAIPHLSIHAAFIQEQQRRKQTLLDFARLQGWGDEQLRRLEDMLARAKTVDEAITEFKRLKDSDFTGVDENPYEAKVVEEKDLIPFIERGYELVRELSDGRFIVKKKNQKGTKIA